MIRNKWWLKDFKEASKKVTYHVKLIRINQTYKIVEYRTYCEVADFINAVKQFEHSPFIDHGIEIKLFYKTPRKLLWKRKTVVDKKDVWMGCMDILAFSQDLFGLPLDKHE